MGQFIQRCRTKSSFFVHFEGAGGGQVDVGRARMDSPDTFLTRFFRSR